MNNEIYGGACKILQDHNRDVWIRWNWWKQNFSFSDEAHFWLNWYVNKRNYRFWSTENPNISILNDSTVTGNSYKELVKTKFFPSIKKRGWVKTFYFMQDGSRPHHTKEVLETIYNVHGNRVIGLEYPKFADEKIEWPSYSPDLNRCDFFLWGYIKDHYHSEKSTATEELMKAIRKTVNSISDEIWSKVLYSFRKRLIVARVVMVNTSKIFIIKFIDFKKC